MKVLILISLVLLLENCSMCEQKDSCSSTTTEDNDTTTNPDPVKDDETKEPQTIVIQDGNSLPACGQDNQNIMAYKENSQKYFICKTNAWEEFDPNGKELSEDEIEEEKASQTKEAFDSFWKEFKAKKLLNNNQLISLCQSIMDVEEKAGCEQEIADGE